MNRMLRLTALLFLATTLLSHAQNCSLSSTGFIPLNDLGTGTFMGYTGGLYPPGTNERPAAHTASGIEMTALVQPLDRNGNTDLANGRIVFLSIGMSNTREEFGTFQMDFIKRTDRNPYVRAVNGAQSGKDINRLLDPLDNYWSVVEDTLERIGLSVNQVQVVWFKEAEANPSPAGFPEYGTEIKENFKTVMNILKDRYPNVKLCYLSSRIYGNYGNPPTNPEPYAYYNGWSVKWLIEDQLNGDSALQFEGPEANSPWLSWGAYTWADGVRPRSDGLQWLCPVDFKPDGTHPSLVGRQKVADMLMDFFSTDPTTSPWFLADGSPPPPPGPPSAPSDLSATATGRSTISLTWVDNSDNEDGFLVERAKGSGAFAQIASIGGDVESYLNRNLLANTLYRYRVRAYNSAGNSAFSNIAQAKTARAGSSMGAPTASNYPNPFNPSTEIRFSLFEHSRVVIKVYTGLGEEIASLLDASLGPGVHQVRFDGSNLASGVYYYRIWTNGGLITGKMFLSK